MSLKKFSDLALDEAYKIKINEYDFSGRPVVTGYTIDGYTSKDLDDGISLSKKGDNHLLQVSIADVAEFVTPGTELFAESMRRVETRYFAGFNDPMLPRIVSESKLSLWPDSLKPAITFDIEINPNGETVDFQIRETAFQSLRKMNYEEFDKILKKKDGSEEYVLFSEMAKLANFLLERRRAKGALAIYDIKKGIYTNEEGTILPLEKGMAHVSNIVIQEFMILTNISLAWYHAKNDLPLLYRNHVPRQSAPKRSEILEQINIAILNLDHLDALRNRGSLWFSKAVYNPTIKGHFGLNEPVYTHVTSPIRRVADLINHVLIKSHLHSKNPAIKFKELTEMSEKINDVILKSNADRINLFKDQAKTHSINKLELTSEQELFNMEGSKFSQILKAGAVSNNLTSQLESALNLRMESNTLDINMIYIILFKSSKESGEWFAMKKDILSYLYNNKGYPTQLLNILEQKEIIDSFEFEVKELDGKFSAKTNGVFNQAKIITPKYSIASSKKDAIHYSACDFLELILDIPFIPEISIKIVKDDPIISEESVSTYDPNENYVGKLYEMYMMNKKNGWDEPVYTFEISGASHIPVVKCKGKLVGAKFIYVEEAVANNKKLAKNLVSEKLWRRFYEQKALMKEEKQKAQNAICSDNANNGGNANNTGNTCNAENTNSDENPNYINQVQEIMQKHKLRLPLYHFKQTGGDHNPMFECELRMILDGESKVINGTGKNKMESKRNAAQNFLLDLKFNHPEYYE